MLANRVIRVTKSGSAFHFDTVEAFGKWCEKSALEINKVFERFAKIRKKENEFNDLENYINTNFIFFREIEKTIKNTKIDVDQKYKFIEKITNLIENNDFIVVPGTGEFYRLKSNIDDGNFGLANSVLSRINDDHKGRVFDYLKATIIGNAVDSDDRDTEVDSLIFDGADTLAQQYIDTKVAEVVSSQLRTLTDPEKMIAERESAERLLAEASENWSKLEEKVSALIDGATLKIESAEQDLISKFSSAAGDLEKAITDWQSKIDTTESEASRSITAGKELIASFEGLANEAFASHRKAMAGMEAAFRARLDLEAPAQLWDEKSSRHADAASKRFKWAIATTSLFGAVVLVGLILVVKYDLFTITDTQGVALALLLAVPLVCGFVVIRVLFRMYNLSQALADDSEHRSALMKSFLALSTETGGGLRDEERLIVLNALFRPTDLSGAHDGAQVHHLFEVAAKRVVGGDKSSAG